MRAGVSHAAPCEQKHFHVTLSEIQKARRRSMFGDIDSSPRPGSRADAYMSGGLAQSSGVDSPPGTPASALDAQQQRRAPSQAPVPQLSVSDERQLIQNLDIVRKQLEVCRVFQQMSQPPRPADMNLFGDASARQGTRRVRCFALRCAASRGAAALSMRVCERSGCRAGDSSE